MKERSIICRDDEVRAFLEGRKTQLRRLIVPQPRDSVTDTGVVEVVRFNLGKPSSLRCPFGIAGDRLWVRECWAPMAKSPKTRVAYRATMTIQNQTSRRGPKRDLVPWPVDNTGRVGHTIRAWRSSGQMPRWASRITLEIIGVHVERLQNITEQAANAEGIVRDDWGVFLGGPYQRLDGKRVPHRCGNARDAFMTIWDSINGGKGDETQKSPSLGWEQNPFVWVIETKVIS